MTTRSHEPGIALPHFMVYRIFLLVLLISVGLCAPEMLAQSAPTPTNKPKLEPKAPQEATGTIHGVVKDAATGETLIGANLFLLNSSLGAASSIDGSFEIPRVPPGEHVLEARMLGFESTQIPVFLAGPRDTLIISIQLNETAVSLSEIVVEPASSSTSNLQTFSPRTFSQLQLQDAPALGGDIYRAMARVPGVTAGDFAAKFMIRGGEHDEVLVTLDGLELYDPFHMKEVSGGGLSIIDAGSIGEVNLLTGAFPAAYGNRLSGVFDIQTATPSDNHLQSSLGISFVNARASTQGTLKNDKTSWMIVGRRGYLDVLLGVVDNSQGFIPQYYDVLGKIQHEFNQKHTLSLHWLNSGDKTTYQEVDDLNDNAQFAYGSTYLWTNWKSIWNSRLFSTTVLSNSTIWRDRNGRDIRNDQMIRFLAKDQRTFNVTNLKQDWTFDVASHYMLSWGIDLKNYQADYTYLSTSINQTVPDPVNDPFYVHTTYSEVDWQGRLSGAMTSLYAQNKIHIGSRLTTEWGARFGHASWTRDTYLEPRFNAAYQLGQTTVLRGGWGHFHQVQGIEQLDIEDGDFAFHKAQRAEHMTIGLEHLFASGISLRLDLYNKAITNVQPRYISVVGDATQFFPEVAQDRRQIHPEAGRSRGIELMVKRENRTFNWWASYTLSTVEEKIEGSYTPKTFDQRHSLNVDLNYRPTAQLRINLAWQFHTGWRYTDVNLNIHELHSEELIIETLYGQYNNERFPGYHRMDLRISYDFPLKNNILSTYLEVRNAYNQQNLRMFTYEPVITPNSVSFQKNPEHWLPILPAIGVEMKINH